MKPNIRRAAHQALDILLEREGQRTRELADLRMRVDNLGASLKAAARELEEAREELAYANEQRETYQVALMNIASGMRGIDDDSAEKMATRFIGAAKRALSLGSP